MMSVTHLSRSTFISITGKDFALIQHVSDRLPARPTTDDRRLLTLSTPPNEHSTKTGAKARRHLPDHRLIGALVLFVIHGVSLLYMTRTCTRRPRQ